MSRGRGLSFTSHVLVELSSALSRPEESRGEDVGIEDPAIWIGLASGVAAVVRPIQNVLIARMALRGAKPSERKEIIEALAKTRQFGLWSKPQWPRRKPQGSPAIESIEPQPAIEDEGA